MFEETGVKFDERETFLLLFHKTLVFFPQSKDFDGY